MSESNMQPNDDFSSAMSDALNVGAPNPSPAPEVKAGGDAAPPSPPLGEAASVPGQGDGPDKTPQETVTPPQDTGDSAPPPQETPAKGSASAQEATAQPPKGGISPDVAAAITAAVAAAKAPETPPTPEPPKQDVPLTMDMFITEDEKKILAEYDKEWGDVAKAEQIRRRADIQFAQAQIFREVGKVLAPIVEAMKQSQVTTHFNTIRASHPDYEALLPSVQTWVGQQPAIYRPTLERVLQSGSTSEVIELLTAYKQAVGSTGAVPATPASSVQQAPAGTPPTVVRPAQQPPAAPSAKAVAATAAVMSQRTGSPTAKDPQDFAAALAEALGT